MENEKTNMEEKKPKLKLACYLLPKKEGEKKDYQFGWNKLDNIYDVWDFIGWLVNRIEVAITFNYLQYYNETWDELKDWIAKVKENDNVVARFSCGKDKYQIEIEEMKG